LEPVVFKRYPEILALKEGLSDLGANGSLLSGSGSTVFAIFDNPDRAKNAYAKVNKGSGEVFLTETVSSFSEFWPQEMLSYALR
jgi:4-diphosphocytidyl-2-C-methyl-D-erythritol kinase